MSLLRTEVEHGIEHALANGVAVRRTMVETLENPFTATDHPLEHAVKSGIGAQRIPDVLALEIEDQEFRREDRSAFC